jgi:hypothetical protein
MRNAHCRTWKMAIKQENKKIRNSQDRTRIMARKLKNVKNKTHTVGPGIW